MKKIKKFIKSNIKVVIAFILGISIAGSIGVYAATVIASSNVEYSNTTSGLTATTVQGAIDEIYEKSKTHCPEGYKCEKLYYYAFGTPDTSSTTDFTTLGENVFARLGSDNSTGVCINDGGLFCMNANDYDNSVAALKEHFGESSCTDFGSSVGCSSGPFTCGADSNGLVGCDAHSTREHCDAYADGSFSCDRWQPSPDIS